jgi:hypothetical protein
MIALPAGWYWFSPMTNKQITIRNIDSVGKYLRIFNGVFNLTPAELDVLEQIVLRQLRQIKAGNSADVFSPGAKAAIAAQLKMAHPYHMNNYVKKLRDKGAILSAPDGQLLVHPWLMPKGEKQIVINLQWSNSK